MAIIHPAGSRPKGQTDGKKLCSHGRRRGKGGEQERWASRGPVQGRLEEVGPLEGTQSEGLLAPGEESVA